MLNTIYHLFITSITWLGSHIHMPVRHSPIPEPRSSFSPAFPLEVIITCFSEKLHAALLFPSGLNSPILPFLCSKAVFRDSRDDRHIFHILTGFSILIISFFFSLVLDGEGAGGGAGGRYLFGSIFFFAGRMLQQFVHTPLLLKKALWT